MAGLSEESPYVNYPNVYGGVQMQRRRVEISRATPKSW